MNDPNSIQALVRSRATSPPSAVHRDGGWGGARFVFGVLLFAITVDFP